MNREYEDQKKIEKHILENRISITILESWIDHAGIMLNTIKKLFQNAVGLCRIIILASKRSIENEWLAHLRRNTYEIPCSYIPALGNEKQKIDAFYSGIQILLTNDESLAWTRNVEITAHDMIVIDELAYYRNYNSERYRSVERMCRKAGRIAAFSRIPFPHGLSEIWEEIYLLDGGVRLGTVKRDFMERYFFLNRIWTCGHMKTYVEPKENAAKAINRAIGDICIDLSAEKVERTNKQEIRNVFVELSRSEMSRYQLMAEQLSMSLGEGRIVSAKDTSRVVGKLLQMTSGTVYDDRREVIYFHKRKIVALQLLLQELKGNHVLIAYWFKHELEHILSAVPQAHVIITRNDIDEWNSGRINVGLINSSMGGIKGDLSKGGNILIWFSLTWSLALYMKTNDRINRQDEKTVIIHLLASDTIDEKVLNTLVSNGKDNRWMIDAIKNEGK